MNFEALDDGRLRLPNGQKVTLEQAGTRYGIHRLASRVLRDAGFLVWRTDVIGKKDDILRTQIPLDINTQPTADIFNRMVLEEGDVVELSRAGQFPAEVIDIGFVSGVLYQFGYEWRRTVPVAFTMSNVFGVKTNRPMAYDLPVAPIREYRVDGNTIVGTNGRPLAQIPVTSPIDVEKLLAFLPLLMKDADIPPA
jgi:hypothetical protein